MRVDRIANVVNNFDEVELYELLGDLKDSLLEWTFNNENITKRKIIDIIISINGINLFFNNDFRYKYFLALDFGKKEECQLLKKLYSFFKISNDQYLLAEKMKNLKFAEKEPYISFINDYLEFPEYEFSKNVLEEPIDTIKNDGLKFFELYDYQYMIKQQVINDLQNPKKALYKTLIHMPTGTGKTKTAMHIISHYINFITKGKGIVVWIAHSDELLKQAFDTFKSVWSHLGNVEIDVFKGWVSYPNEIKNGILFTSIQGLMAKMQKPIFKDISEKASLIVFDEVHKVGASKYKQCIDLLMQKANDYGKRFIGLTATPGRTTEFSRENTIFSNEYDNIVGIDVDRINAISLTENETRNYRGSKDPIGYFQERGILSKLQREELDYQLSLDILEKLEKQINNNRDEYSDDLIKEIAVNKSRNMKIIEKLKILNEKKIPTIVFSCSLQHAKMLSAYLKMIDIPNSLVHGDLDGYSRDKAIKDFKDVNNDVNIIINYEILTTGFDSTNIKCVFITRPTKSVILYSQMIGRGLRGPKMGGNEKCLLIDVKENLLKYDVSSAFEHFNKYWK